MWSKSALNIKLWAITSNLFYNYTTAFHIPKFNKDNIETTTINNLPSIWKQRISCQTIERMRAAQVKYASEIDLNSGTWVKNAWGIWLFEITECTTYGPIIIVASIATSLMVSIGLYKLWNNYTKQVKIEAQPLVLTSSNPNLTIKQPTLTNDQAEIIPFLIAENKQSPLIKTTNLPQLCNKEFTTIDNRTKSLNWITNN